MPLQAGSVLNNRYRIVKLLGQGGFGAVYRAWDMNLKGPCAVKENFDASPAAQAQFEREASMLFNLRHPNLPKVFDSFTLSGQGQYLVMDYIEGEDLSQMLERTGAPLPEAQALAWIGQVCDALNYMHSQNPSIIHRDLKPANIRITPQGQAMLVDFGIAKLYDPSLRTTMGARAVTPGYSPNEQYLSQGRTDARTDIYALGATLYTLFTCQTPPEAPERNMGVALTPIRSFNPSISQRVEAAVMKALQMQPGDRWQSAAEFKRAVSSVQVTVNSGQLPGGSVQSTVKDIQSTLNSWLGVAGSAQQPAGSGAPPALRAHIPSLQAAPGPAASALPSMQANQKSKISNLKYAGALVVLAVVALILWVLFGGDGKKPDPAATQDALRTEGAKPTRRPTATDILEPTGTFTPLPPTATPTETRTPTATGLPGQITDEKGVALALVPAGEFLMGSADSDSNASSAEKPQHRVNLDAYYMDIYEVTNAQYAACVQDGTCTPPDSTSSNTRDSYYGAVAYENYPVINVDWSQAQAYCRWRGGDLPTEAQWEKAARGGLEGKLYPWGDEDPDCGRANFEGGCVGDTQAVGSYSPNGYGLYDMAGNVWEWVSDWYQDTFYNSSPLENPTGPSSSGSRVVRGGSWLNESWDVRAANRSRDDPTNRSVNVGLRCARSP